jgi:predicted RNA-binding Zn-ribbon protein involved in translation (DUF1610 family)
MKIVTYKCDVCGETVANDEIVFEQLFHSDIAWTHNEDGVITKKNGTFLINDKKVSINLELTSNEINHVCNKCYEQIIEGVFNPAIIKTLDSQKDAS